MHETYVSYIEQFEGVWPVAAPEGGKMGKEFSRVSAQKHRHKSRCMNQTLGEATDTELHANTANQADGL